MRRWGFVEDLEKKSFVGTKKNNAEEHLAPMNAKIGAPRLVADEAGIQINRSNLEKLPKNLSMCTVLV